MIQKISRFAVAAVLACSVVTAARGASVTRQIPSAGSAQIPASTLGVDGLSMPEFSPAFDNVPGLQDGPSAAGTTGTLSTHAVLQRLRGFKTNRSIARKQGRGEWVDSVGRNKPDRHLVKSFDGESSRSTRLANNGNQFSIEPPDQALCAGNGYVLESINDVMKIFDRSGTPLTGDIALNSFYGYPAAIDRAAVPRTFGPAITDPVCYYDPQVRRWFHAVLTLDTDPATGGETGGNHLDLAVSSSANPLGSWTIYKIPVQNDGTQGSPVHPNCPCLGDYPHIGADANGIYLTTNEFPFSGGFNSAQIYAISKKALVSGSTSVNLVQLDTADYLLDGNPGFTVWPAVSPSGDAETDHGGTEFLLSSVAVFSDTGNDHRLRVWALNNTRSLNSKNPAVSMVHNVVNVDPYGVPPVITQKPGNTPLADCINDRAMATPFGTGCWNYLTSVQPATIETLGQMDPNDSRMQQVFYTGGRLFGALDTVVTVGQKDQTGIAYYVLRPSASRNRVSAFVERQGKIAVANNNVTRPAIAALPNGRGVIGFTLVGADHYPSAAYIRVNQRDGHRGDTVRVIAEGRGPDDGFSEYNLFGTPAGRWGDYGAAALDGDHIWIASEYVGQNCTLAEFADPASLFNCNGTRVSLTNWGTRLTLVNP